MARIHQNFFIAGTLLVLTLSIAAACAGDGNETVSQEAASVEPTAVAPEPTNTLVPHVGTQTAAREKGYKTAFMKTESPGGIYGFVPNRLTFDEGDTVRLLLMGEVEPMGYGYHTFTLPSQGFAVLVPARTKSVWLTFDEPGEFDFYCEPHPWMKGKITVLPKTAEATDAS